MGFLAAAAPALVTGVLSLFNKKKKAKKKSTLDKNQKKLYNDYTQSLYGDGPFSDLYNFDEEKANSVFDQTIGRPAYRNFEENVIPGITGQYRNNGIQNSSYSGEALSRAGRNVQEGLDAQRANYIFQGQNNANTNKQNAINGILNTNTQAYVRPEQGGSPIDQILNSAGPAAGEWFADYLKKNPTTGGA